MSRRRLLFLGSAAAAGVLFTRVFSSVRSDDSVAAPDVAETPQGHGEHHGTPEPQETTDAIVAGTDLVRWSDPATWKGKLPGPGDVAKIDRPILMDLSPTVAGVEIGPSGWLVFDPNADRTLTSKNNVVVRGKLTMRPGNAGIDHRLIVTGAKESAFKGGGALPLASDTGVWVVSGGVLDAVGTARRGWVRAAGSIAKGAKKISLAEAPKGWRAGDEVVIVPTRAPWVSAKQHAEYDTATISSISGKTVTLSRATAYPHPKVDVGSKVFAAEVLNLTRNVRIEGKPGARIHVFMNSSRKQTIRYVALRHVGPRQGTNGVLGRYGLHFHMAGNASRGSLVEGCVVRQAGHHAFVPHGSHGVTIRDCVAHDVMSSAYWWDPGPGNATRDAVIDRCVASYVHTDGPDFRLSAFWLGHGEGNVARGCVAVGVAGERTSSGFQWPEDPGPREDGTVWDFTDCVAHNNKVNGIFVWQNNLGKSVIDRFVAYHNGKAGIEHGAYKNVYRYKNSTLYGNGVAGAFVHAVSGDVVPLSFTNVVFDGAGKSQYAVLFERHTAPPNRPSHVTGCTFKGYTKAAFGLVDDKTKNEDLIDVVNCSFSGNQFWLSNQIDPGSVIRVQDAKLGTIALRRYDQPGTYNAAWNARVTPIAKFA